MSSRTGRSWARAALLAGVVLALDQAVKALVRATIERGTTEAIVPGIELVHTRNTGVAFGALAGGGAIVTVVIAVALAAAFLKERVTAARLAGAVAVAAGVALLSF